MVEISKSKFNLPYQLLRFVSHILVGAVFAQMMSCLVSYFTMSDSQAGGMLAHSIIQNLSHYFLACAFIALSLSNILIKRGVLVLKIIRLPALTIILSTSVASFLLIPRMDYLQETALLDGMPVMASHLANYFVALNLFTFLMLVIQAIASVLMAWRLGHFELS